MKKLIRKTVKNIAAFILVAFMAVVVCIPAVSRIASAEERSFDNTDIMKDLSNLDLSEYPAKKDGDIQMLRFMEYCFSSTSDNSYGLYIYIYNPMQIEISTREGANTANLAVKYTRGNPSEYANVTLKCCDYSTGVYSRLFYKFRVIGEEVERIYDNAKASELSQGKRRYDLAGVQFWEKGKSEATLKGNTASGNLGAVRDYSVSRTFYFSGYAKGYGKGAENSSTLTCAYDELATIKLDLQHTNWRNPTEYKTNTYEEVNSVYFSIPNEVFETYGALQGIKAEWYEYKTSPIFVTKDEDAYNQLLEWVAVDVGEYTSANPWRVLWEKEIFYSHVVEGRHIADFVFNSIYNQKPGHVDFGGGLTEDFAYSASSDAKKVTSIDWLFYRKNPSSLSDYEVSREEVEDWAKQYSLENKTQKRVDARKTFYAEGLFADSIDEDRVKFLKNPSHKRGYTVQEIFADQKVDLLEYKNQEWWERWLGKKKSTTTAVTYSPIHIVTESDIKGTASYVSEKLLVNERDVDGADGENNELSFREYCQNALDNAATPVLFRFANTDYYASAAYFDYLPNDQWTNQDGYVCQQTCFLDFDVISLTFEKSGKETVLAVIADPIDIFNGTTPPNNLKITIGTGINWKKILAIVLIVVVLIIAWKIYRKIRDAVTLKRARKEQRKNRRQRK